ncbi:MAG TPA: TonB-dependent receptor, partial [Chitinophagaceae bacterium]|nr:TonB-dependent receptor [Chitinophagaceae bacterium]
FSKLNVEALGIFSDSSNANEWSGRLFLRTSTQYQYGYQPDTLKFTKDELRQQFTTFGGQVGLRNKKENEAGISYSPSVSLNMFNDNRDGKEANFVVNAPFSKSFGKIFAFNLGLTADVTSYKSDSGTVNNNLYYLNPAIQFNTPNFRLIAGVTPSWNNSTFAMLPNVSAEAKIKDEKFILQAGWIGYFNKTTYQSLAEMNPWLSQPHSFLNTRIAEQYAGFKGSAGDHFTYNAKVSYLQFTNQPLFVNDTITGRSFQVVNESHMKDIRIHGEIGYTVQEKFSLLAGASFNQYSNLSDNLKPWGLLPVEINGALRWQVVKDVWVKGDVFFWDGAQYRNKQLQAQKLDPAIDLNAGLEFKIVRNFNFWAQFNNLFNNQYERWHQYPVLGFNVLLGVVYSF